MKILHLLIGAMLLCLACSDDESSSFKCSDCVNEPEALAENDDIGKGIYKGLVVGSSGTIKFNIANAGETYSGVLMLDEVEYELYVEEGNDYDEDTGFGAVFYGTKNTTDDIEITLYVDKYGNAEIYPNIPDHPDVTIELYKEFSDAIVKVYEGTYTGDSEGTFNMIVQDDYWDVIADTSEGHEDFSGSLEGNEMLCDCSDPSITGKISGDEASGTWESVAGEESGTWKGKRTL